MPSPFPGMDPWLEDEEVFPNLHEKLTVYLSEALNAVMPPGYVATVRNRVWVDDEVRREPDVAVLGRGRTLADAGVTTLTGLVAVGRQLVSDEIEEPYLEILSPRGRRLVTAVEIISLANKKAGEKGRKTYQDKQEEYRLSAVSLVEIDLLRRGPHVSAIPADRIRKAAGPFDYHVSVVAAGAPPSYHAAAVRLADRLPAIGIPLDPGTAPVTVDLQPLLDRAYDTGRYPELVRYDRPPDPPLTPEQQAWAEGVLREKGLLPAPGGAT